MPEEFAAASASHIFPKRHKHVRETIEIMQGIWTNDLFEYHGEFADFDRWGFGPAGTAAAPADLLQRAQGPEALGEPHRQVRPVGLDRDPGRAGRARAVARRDPARARGAPELRSIDDLEICSMIWFVITDEETDQTPQGKGTNLMVGTARRSPTTSSATRRPG